VSRHGESTERSEVDGVSDPSEIEREAERVVAALRGIAAQLRSGGGPTSSCLPVLAGEGVAAAERVLAHLRSMHRPGDGAFTAYPAHLPLWRDWSPSGGASRPGRDTSVPWPGRGDPGE